MSKKIFFVSFGLTLLYLSLISIAIIDFMTVKATYNDWVMLMSESKDNVFDDNITIVQEKGNKIYIRIETNQTKLVQMNKDGMLIYSLDVISNYTCVEYPSILGSDINTTVCPKDNKTEKILSFVREELSLPKRKLPESLITTYSFPYFLVGDVPCELVSYNYSQIPTNEEIEQAMLKAKSLSSVLGGFSERQFYFIIEMELLCKEGCVDFPTPRYGDVTINLIDVKRC